MPNLKKVAVLSIAVLIAQILLIKVVSTLLGSTIQGYFINIPLTLTIKGILTVVIGTLALIYAGMLLYEQKIVKLWKGKNLSQRLFAILLYSHIALFVISLIVNTWITNISLISLAINLVVLSLVVTISAKRLNFPRI